MKNLLSKKLNIFKSSPLISVVAIIEVILLICVSTFAWFVYAENNQINTNLISVEPDSGLQIDFNDEANNDYVNIWNYLNEFQFEPVTSLDGRNIFVPTTGTFNATETGNIKFREATVNDMNSKYICIDFTLTNSGDEDMPVFLNSKSYFTFDNSANGKALRLAFYQNDGSSGKVTSSLLSKEYEGEPPTEDPDDPSQGGQEGTYTVYLNAPSKWETEGNPVWVYMWNSITGAENGSFPGVEMEYDSSTGLYSFTCDAIYNKVVFSSWPSGDNSRSQTVDLDLYDEGTYTLVDDGRTGSWALKDIDIDGGTLADGNGSSSGGNTGDNGNDGESEGQTTVYFNNTLGWKQPYAYIWRENGNADEPLSAWPGKPMTHISGSIYYYTFNSKYDSIIFNDGNSQGGAVKTGDIYPVKDGHIYMIGSSAGDNTFGWESEDYVGTVEGGTYPVISPGVSTGFQRPYAPVIEIDDNSGLSEVVIPAFASSIDDYNFGSENPLFTIKSKQTLSLSMIVWLEGTDPDCTADVYSGKDIDMNLIFATKDSGEAMYTYRFLDKTRENWIDDWITTDTGVSFKPVIQLYDVVNQKGYMMSVHDDEEGNPTIWQCIAPEDLINSEHIMFRRVNPMNEDEVWNYWDTDGFKDLGIVEDSVVTFTAFSDGSPTNAKNENGTSYTGAPAKSCGGLWGNHEVHTVTLFDGTKDQWIKNSDKDGTTAVMTMNYLYKYPGGKTQTVEYKASGATDKGMYYFVVPYDVYSKNGGNHTTQYGSVTFKRYFNFNDKHALNSDLNELTYHMSWDAGVCNGKFYEVTENDGNKWGYWGSDMLYVQAKSVVKSKMDNAWLQVRFYANNNTSTSNNDFITYLYKNDYYKPDDGGYGYACVVPSNRNYYKYRVERCNPNSHSEVWNTTPLQTVTASTSDNNAYSNTVGKNICSIENMQVTIFLQLSTNYCGYNDDPSYYIWNSSTNAEGAGGYPGTVMTYHDGITGYSRYKCTVDISNYNRIIFSNSNKGYKSQDITIGTDSDVNGMIYEGNSSNNATKLSTTMSGYDTKETLKIALYEAEYWDINGTAGTN